MIRIAWAPALAVLLVSLAQAKDKHKAVLPTEVLRAQTVVVVINPEVGEPVSDPTANRRAQDDVERALMKWGRFRLAMESRTADLVIAVRKGTGRLAGPTIGGPGIDDRPVIVQPTIGDTRVGGQHGRPPDLSQPGLGSPQDTGPRVGTQVGPSEDMLEVFRGGVDYPLDAPAVWRYIGKDSLRAPAVPAVEQFRKAIEESEKAAAQKQQKKQKP